MSGCKQKLKKCGCLGLNFFYYYYYFNCHYYDCHAVFNSTHEHQHTFIFTLPNLSLNITFFKCEELQADFFLLVSSFSFIAQKAVVSVALTVTSFIFSSAQLTFLKKKNFASWNLSLNFVAVSPGRMVLLGGLEKGKSKWTGNYVYGQFEVTSLHIG